MKGWLFGEWRHTCWQLLENGIREGQRKDTQAQWQTRVHSLALHSSLVGAVGRGVSGLRWICA